MASTTRTTILPELPLQGLRVLDLGQIYNGPYAGLLLALAGADVVKVEPPGGERLRTRPNINGADYPFLVLNASKRTVALDLKDSGDRSLFLQLVGVADVLIENYRPGTMERLGLGHRELLSVNPCLVYASGTGYGSDGPYKDLLAMDLTVQAMAGIMDATGFPDQPPVKAGPALCDFLAGIHLYAGITSALVRRSRTGRGGLVEVSMFESVLPTLLSNLAPVMLAGLSDVHRTGNHHGGMAEAPYNVYPAVDGYVAIICVGEHHWQNLVGVMGRPDLLEDPRFATRSARVTNMEEVDLVVGEWTSVRKRDDVMSELSAAGVPAAPVRSLEEVAEDEHLMFRGMFRTVEHPEHGDVTLISSPIRYDGAAPPTPSPCHELNQDFDGVVLEWLGPGR